MQLQKVSLPPRPPERYWKDSEWAIQNIQVLTEEFPEEWVAVYEEEVVVHDVDLGRVQSVIQSQGFDSPVIKFIERGIHVYKHFARVPDEI